MLLLALFLGSSIVVFFIREGISDTYRCPYCAQIEVGPHHRLRCFLQSRRERSLRAPSVGDPREYHQAANQDGSGLVNDENGRDSYRNRIVSSLRAIIGRRGGSNGASAGLGRHLHVAP